MSLKYGVSNWIFGDENLETTFKRLQRYGYDGVELVGEPEQYDVDEVLRLCDRYGLKVLTVCGMFPWPTSERDLGNPDSEVRRRAVEYVQRCCDMAAALGSSAVVCTPCPVMKNAPVDAPREETGWREKAGREREFAVESVRQAARRAAERGVTLAIEPINRYETYMLNTIEQGLEFVEQVGTEGLSVHLDTFHMNIEDKDPVGCVEVAGSRIGNVHIADSNRKAVGYGHFDFPGFVEALVRVGYDGPVNLEPLPPLPDPYIAARLKSAEHLKDEYAKASIERLREYEARVRS